MINTRKRVDWERVKERLRQSRQPDGGADSAGGERWADVMRERAERLAGRGRRSSSKSAQTPVLVFRYGSEQFGVELAHVKQIFPRVAITLIPTASEILMGVAHLNGKLRSIIDLGRVLNLTASDSESGHVVLLRMAERVMGVWVESLGDVAHIDLKSLAPLDSGCAESGSRCVKGVTDDRVLVLDAAQLLELASGACGNH
jgi:purine-binding chemotaxis protein CheW